MNAGYYIGIDAGGTTWDAVLCGDDNKIIAGNSFEGLNLRTVSNPIKVALKLQQAIKDVSDQCGLLSSQISLTTLAGAGAGDASLRKSIEDACREVIPQNRVKVVTDADAALEGAFDGGAGIIVIAGTGSIAFGRDGEGNFARSGGYGYLFGDEGSGFWIGKQAMQICLDAYYKGDDIPLAGYIRSKFKIRTINEILSNIYASANPVAKTAEIAPVVFEAAESGDEVAKSIIIKAGEEIGQLVKDTADKLKFPDKIRYCLMGGLSSRLGILHEYISSRLYDNFESVTPLHPPAVGAVMLGRKLVKAG